MIGTMRVHFEYDICGPATVIAQQVLDDKGKITFRKWNPEQQYPDILDESKNELQLESEQGFLHRVLFGCIGKNAQTMIDYSEDDIVNLNQYLEQV